MASARLALVMHSHLSICLSYWQKIQRGRRLTGAMGQVFINHAGGKHERDDQGVPGEVALAAAQ